MPGVFGLLEKAAGIFAAIPGNIAEAPYLALVYALVALYFALFVAAVLRGRFLRAATNNALALATAILFAIGHDMDDHVGRLLLLKEELTSGELDLFVRVGADSLPVFYYYSTGLYVFALPLTLAGVTAATSLRIVVAGFFLVMTYGARRLFVEIVPEGHGPGGARGEVAGLMTVVFLTSNYVFLDFAHRNAFPEAAVFALIPAAVLALRHRRTFLSVALLSLQASLHPAVFPQAAVAVALAHLALSDRAPAGEIARVVGVMLAGVLLASPVWLYPLLHKAAIYGVDGLPVRFEETFLGLTDIVKFHHYHSPGLYLILLLPLVVWKCGAWRGRAGVLLTAAAVTLVLQLDLASPLVTRIPLADLGLFIWRWMFVTVWFGVLVLSLRWCLGTDSWAIRALVLLASFLAVVLVTLRIQPVTPDRDYSHYTSPQEAGIGEWGFGEYYPDYGPPVAQCATLAAGESRPVRFDELLAGVGVSSALPLAVPNAPTGIVAYSADGDEAVGVGCGDTLYLSPPLARDATVFRARLDLPGRYPAAKVFFPVLPLALTLLALILARRPRARRSAG